MTTVVCTSKSQMDCRQTDRQTALAYSNAALLRVHQDER